MLFKNIKMILKFLLEFYYRLIFLKIRKYSKYLELLFYFVYFNKSIKYFQNYFKIHFLNKIFIYNKYLHINYFGSSINLMLFNNNFI